jgi:hypothetical protein
VFDFARTTDLIISLVFMGKEVFCSLYPFTAKSRQDMNSCFTTFSARLMIWQNYLDN